MKLFLFASHLIVLGLLGASKSMPLHSTDLRRCIQRSFDLKVQRSLNSLPACTVQTYFVEQKFTQKVERQRTAVTTEISITDQSVDRIELTSTIVQKTKNHKRTSDTVADGICQCVQFEEVILLLITS